MTYIHTNYVMMPLYQEGLTDKLERLGVKYNCVCVESSVKHMVFESLDEQQLRAFNAAVNASSTEFWNAKAGYAHKYKVDTDVQPNYLKLMIERLSEHYDVA